MQDSFRFENQEYLYFLAFIPVLVLIFIILRLYRKRQLAKFGDLELIAPLIAWSSGARATIRFSIVCLAIAFAILAVARPQFGEKLEEVKREGVELVIALDVSNSMLAEDLKPNRLERAKRSIEKLVGGLKHDKLGLIVFAGDAYTQLPITTDYGAAKMFLQTINTNLVEKQGTAIGSAIELGMRSFSPDESTSKAIIIITDGENHEDDALKQAELAKEKGIVVHTIGMGLSQGTPIPMYNRRGQKDYHKDRQGKVVMTKLNEGLLKEVARKGEGVYVRANNARTGLSLVLDEIGKMDKGLIEEQIYADFDDKYQYFLFVSFFLLILEFMILERKNKMLKDVKLFE